MYTPFLPNSSLHIHHISDLEKHYLKNFSRKLLAFIDYLQEYHTGILPLFYNNPIAKMLWPPENGWPITLAQFPKEIELCDKLSTSLRAFLAEDQPRISSIELLLSLHKFVASLPGNSLFFSAPGVKETILGIKDLVHSGKEILTIKMPESMTMDIIAKELQLSLSSLEMHRKILNNLIDNSEETPIELSSNHTDLSTSLNQQTSSLQAIAEILLLLGNIERYLCKVYLLDDLIKHLPLTHSQLDEIKLALEKSQFAAVNRRLTYIREHSDPNTLDNLTTMLISHNMDPNNTATNTPTMIAWLLQHSQAEENKSDQPAQIITHKPREP